MMKNITFILIALFLYSCESAPPNDWYKPFEGMKGDVESYTEKSQEGRYEDGEIRTYGEYKITKEVKFNKIGQYTDYKNYNQDSGELTYHEYDIEWNSNNFASKRSIERLIGYEAMQKLTNRLISSNKDGLIFAIEYEEGGKMVADSIYSEIEDYKVSEKIIKHDGTRETSDIVFDKNKNITEQQFRSNKKVVFWKRMEYNDKNFLIKETNESDMGDGETVYTYTYKTDDKGNWIERTRANKSSNQVTVTLREIVYR